MSGADRPVRVGLLGCGAVAQLYYGPALERLAWEGRIEVVAVHDPDARAAQAFLSRHRGASATTSLEDLVGHDPRLVIVASPPQHHAQQVLLLLDRGVDVHCEKPLAANVADGERMVRAAASSGRRLSVGLVRRHFPATQAIAQLLAAGSIGRVTGISCFEGGPFSWPVRSADYFSREKGSAGVLQDIGTHCLDLLVWWFGEPTGLRYADDALGGVEANCEIDLRFGELPATVRLSRDWLRPNEYVLTGTKGSIRWTVNEPAHFDLAIGGTAFVGHVALTEAAPDGRAKPPERAVEFDDVFADQLRMLTASNEDSFVSGHDALSSLRLVERCSANRRTMSMPWLTFEPVTAR